MSIEAMKQALEALEYLQGIVDTERGPKAAKALRQAIATEESSATQEPVGIVGQANTVLFNELPVGTHLYTHPQPKAEQFDHQKAAQDGLRNAMNRSQEIAKAAQPKAEQDDPDDLTIAYMSGLHRGKELAEQDPKREWVELTDEDYPKERKDDPVVLAAFKAGANWAEAKLKEKNT